jgi:hypothetical protein
LSVFFSDFFVFFFAIREFPPCAMHSGRAGLPVFIVFVFVVFVVPILIDPIELYGIGADDL